MGNMTPQEKVGLVILSVVFAPFILIGRALKSIGESLGLIEKENYDYDPLKDPNYRPPEEEQIGTKKPVSENGQSVPSGTSKVSKPKIGQGFENPNKLDPNS